MLMLMSLLLLFFLRGKTKWAHRHWCCSCYCCCNLCCFDVVIAVIGFVVVVDVVDVVVVIVFSQGRTKWAHRHSRHHLSERNGFLRANETIFTFCSKLQFYNFFIHTHTSADFGKDQKDSRVWHWFLLIKQDGWLYFSHLWPLLKQVGFYEATGAQVTISNHFWVTFKSSNIFWCCLSNAKNEHKAKPPKSY